MKAGVYWLQGERPTCPVCGCVLVPGQVHSSDGQSRDQAHVSYEVDGVRWVQIAERAGGL